MAGSGGAVYPGPGLNDKGKDLGPQKQKPKKLKTVRYGRSQKTSGGVRKRAQRRLRTLGDVDGVNAKDGITGGEARKIRSSWLDAGKPKPKPTAKKRNATRRTPSGYDPLQPLSGRSLNREVNAEAKLQYGPQFRQLDSERRISQQASVNDQSWYNNYLQVSQQAAQQQASYTKGFQDAAYQQANTAAASDQAQNASQLAQQNQSAAIRGTAPGPEVAQNMQAGVAARQAQGTAMGGVLAAQGQAQTGYLEGRVGTAAGEGIQAQVDEQRRRSKIEQLAQELKGEMGAFKIKARGELRESERKYALERSAFDLDVTKESNDAAQAAADDKRQARTERRNAARDRLLNASTRADIKKKKGAVALDRNADLADDGQRNYSTDYSEWAQRTRPDKGGKGDGIPDSGKYKGFSESERDKFDTAYDLLERQKVNPKNAQEALAALIHEEGVPPRIAKRALHRWLRVRRKRRQRLNQAQQGAGQFF